MYQFMFFFTGYLQLMVGLFLSNRPLAIAGIFMVSFCVLEAVVFFNPGGGSNDDEV